METTLRKLLTLWIALVAIALGSLAQAMTHQQFVT
jgi:hypothetical protein